MYFRDVVGQDIAKAELIRSYSTGAMPHARLFVGADGMGALGLAYAYARYINCASPSAEDACGSCPSCRRYDSYSVQDLLFLFPIVNVGSRNLCEDALPDWRRFLQRGPHSLYTDWLEMQGGDAKRLSIFAREGEQLMQRLSYQIAEAKYRILLIWLPERMNEALGNKLLKLTEEPPARTQILMVTQNEAEVLGTLRSRMQTVHLRPVSEQLIAQRLGGLRSKRSNASALESAHLSGGNYRQALDDYLGNVHSNDEHLAYFKRILRATVNAQPAQNKPLVEEIAKLSREEQIDLVRYMAQLFREIFAANYDLREVSYLRAEELPIAQYIKACMTAENLRLISSELDLAVRHIGQNVNSKMVFFDLLLRLTSALAQDYKRMGIR
ncbi:MAG: DNA polymerase III subunit delta [Porphyromonas sp.]|nr:DNA polymerase III subunit delta [Porphyromonas sp.]